MAGKIKFITQEALEELWVRLPEWYKLFGYASNDRLEAALAEAKPGVELFIESAYDLPPEDLIRSKEGCDEITNIARLYGPLRDLPPLMARDERLWAGMALTSHWGYVVERWNIRHLVEHNKAKAIGAIQAHFLFNANPRRSFTRHALARLWWLGRMTYDETLPDPYYRTRIIMQDRAYIIDLIERSFSNNPAISSEFIDAVEAARAQVAPEGKVIKREELRVLCKYLNLLGGVHVLDQMTGGKIHEKIFAKAVEIARLPHEPPKEKVEEKDGAEGDDNV